MQSPISGQWNFTKAELVQIKSGARAALGQSGNPSRELVRQEILDEISPAVWDERKMEAALLEAGCAGVGGPLLAVTESIDDIEIARQIEA